MAKTRDLLLKIARENDLPVARIEELIKTVEDEWYSDSELLLEISESQWKTLGIPARIVGLIKKSLSEDPKILSSSRESTLSKLVSSFPQRSQDLINCISILQQIVFNLLTSNLPKYRTLKLSNPKFHQAIGGLPLGVEYLRCIGFILLSNELKIDNANTEILEQSLNELNNVALNLEIPIFKQPEKFNPFKASLSSTNFNAPKIAVGENDPLAITEEINKIKKQRVDVLKRVSVSRNQRVYRITGNTNFNIDEEAHARYDEEIMKKNIQSILVQREASMSFQNKRKNELEKLKSREFIAKVTIKIRFPDGFILEGDFSLIESIKDVYEFVQNNLEIMNKFYLFMAPPKKIIKACDEKLSNYAPASLLQFSWNDDLQTEFYLKRRWLN